MSAETLAAEVERLKAKKLAEGKLLEIEQHESAIADEPDRAVGVGEALPEILESLTRTRNAWKAFCESTRPAFEDAKEFASCSEHPLEQRPKLFEETCQASRMAQEFTVVYAPCQSCQNAKTKAQQGRFWSRRGVPQRLIDATLSNFNVEIAEQATALKKVKKWNARNGTFLILTGTPGTGKGHLSVGCMKAHGDGLFITHPDMLSDLRASYTLHTTPDLIESWKQSEIFVLDEFGVSPGGKDEEPLLYQVLATRYDQRKPTIITSNLEISALRDAIGYRLIDRITEDCTTVVCKWESSRKKK